MTKNSARRRGSKKSRVLLQTKDFKGYYRGMFGVVHGVDGVSITIKKGERVAIAGESGCGKSTFLDLLTGTPPLLLHYENGEAEIGGYNVWKISPEVLRKEVKCKHMAYVPQAAMSNLNPVWRLREFIAEMLTERAGRKYSAAEAREIATDHFEKLGLDKRVLDLYPHELSGGMKQRATIAISTLTKPKLLMVDEPTSALDVTSQKAMIKMLLEIQRKGIVESILCVSHDLGVLRQLCNRLIIMYCGKFVEEGKMGDVVEKPLHPYSQALLASMVPLEEDVKNRSLLSIPGRPPDLRNPPPGCRFHPRCEKCMEICRSREPPTIKRKGRRVKCWLYSRGRSK